MTNETSQKRKSASEEQSLSKKAKVDSVAAEETPTSFTNEDQTDSTLSTSSNGDPKDDKTVEEKPENGAEDVSVKASSDVTSKPVFGAASAFGSASIFEKMKNKTNVFDSLPSKFEDKPKEAAGTAAGISAVSSFGSFGGSFGSGSKFSNALHKASQKKSFLDEPKEEVSLDNATSAGAQSQQYKQVELTEKKVETGEENEKSMFSNIAKLFELDLSNIAEGWKERGRGPLHLNRSIINTSDARLLMRSNGLLRVILNYKITPASTLIKGLEASMSPGKFLRITSVSAEGKPIQYMLKFSNEDVRNELFDKVEELKKELEKVESLGSKPAEDSKPQATGFRFIPDPSDAKEK